MSTTEPPTFSSADRTNSSTACQFLPFSRICQLICSNFRSLKNKKQNVASKWVPSYPPRVRVFFFPDSCIVSTAKGGYSSPPKKWSSKTKRKSTSCYTPLIRMARKPYPVHNIHAYQCIHDHDCMHSTNTPVPAHIRIPLSSIALTLSTRDLDRPMLAFSITLVLGCLARYFTHEERWVCLLYTSDDADE